MQLTRRVGPLACALWIAGCEPGGIPVSEPRPPDAPLAGSSSGDMADGGLDQGDDTAGDSGGDDGSVTLVPAASTWRVSASAASGWTTVSFDDSGWAELVAPIGRGYDDATEWGSDGTVYFRQVFSGDIGAEPLELRVRRDDAAIAYLDGEEVARFNVAPDGSMVAGEVDGADRFDYFVASPPPPSGEGPHVLAIEVLQGDDPDLVFDARLRTIDTTAPLESVLISVRTRSYDGMFAPANVGAIWIEDMAGNFVRSVSVWGGVRREHLVSWNASSSDNRVDAVTAATAEAHHSWLAEWDLRDADGIGVPPGVYTARFELVEENANEGQPPGPNTSVSFSTASRGQVSVGGVEFLEDIIVFVP